MTNTAAATVTAAICDVCAHYAAGFDPADIHVDAWPAATVAGPLAYGGNPATVERSDSNLIGACGQCGTAHPRGAYWDIVAMPAAAAAAALSAATDTYVSPAAVAAPAACTHWECALMGDTCTVTGAPAMMPPRTRRTYRARRIARRFFEYTADGITPSDDPEDFNVDGEPYATDDDAREFDSVADMVAAIRRDYVSFAAYGDGMTASDPDGSQIIDYATGAREAVSWHLDAVSPALLARVIIPAVDAR